MAEYVCLDGRMSVNGICPASSYPGYQDSDENIVTPPITNVNQNDSRDGDGDNNIIPTKTFDQKYQEIEDIPKPGYRIRDQLKRDFLEGGIYKDAKKSLGETFEPITNKAKDFSKDVKSNFEWDFDKVGNKIQNFGTTIKSNINAYDSYVEDNLGIPKGVSYGARAISVGMGIAKYGAVGALAPFAIPFIAGAALNSQKRKEEYEKASIINKAETAVIQNKVDTQYQDQLTKDGRDFSVSGPDTSANPTGKSNRASQERGYSLHG